MSQEKSKVEKYRDISDRLHQENPKHEAISFYDCIVAFSLQVLNDENLSKEDAAKYAAVLRNPDGLDIEEFAHRTVIRDFLPEDNKDYKDMEDIDKFKELERKYNEIEAELVPKSKPDSWLESKSTAAWWDSKLRAELAQNLLGKMEERYKAERSLLAKKIREEEYSRPENQVKPQATKMRKDDAAVNSAIVNVNEEKKIIVEEKRVPVETDAEKKIRIGEEDKKYRAQYEEKRKNLVINQHNINALSDEFSNLYCSITNDSKSDVGFHTKEFLEKESELKKIRREILSETESKPVYSLDEIKTKIIVFDELNAQASNFLAENNDFLATQRKHHKSEHEERQIELEYLIDENVKERTIFDSNKKRLEEFSENIKELIQIAGEDVVIADLQHKQTEIQKEIKNSNMIVKSPDAKYKNNDFVTTKKVSEATLELNMLKEVNVEVKKMLESNKDFFEIQKPAIDMIRAKKQKAIDEYAKERNNFTSNIELLVKFSEGLKEVIESVGEYTIVTDLRKKQTEIQEKIEINKAAFVEFAVEQYTIMDVLSVKMRGEIEEKSNKLRDLNVEMSAIVKTNEIFLEEQKPKIDAIREKQKAITEIDEKIVALKVQQNNLQEIGKDINDDIAIFSTKLNQSAEKAKKALDGLVLAVTEKIKEDVKTRWEKIPILGSIILFFTGDPKEKMQKEKAHPLATELKHFQEQINGAIAGSKMSDSKSLRESANSLFGYIKKLNSLCERYDINNETFEDQSANFHDLAAALTAKIPNYVVKEKNINTLERISKELLEAENMKATLMSEKDKFIEAKDGIGYVEPKLSVQNHSDQLSH